MRLTKEQHNFLCQYLKDVGIRHQEPFEELYDHIATAFEQSSQQDIRTYIYEIAQPDFGGTSGIMRIVNEQNKIRKSIIWSRAKTIFIGLFGWPTIVVVLVSFLLVQFGIKQLGQQFILILSLGLGLALPATVALYGHLTFHFNCKQKMLPYRSNNRNSWLLNMIHFPFLILNIGGNLIIPIMIGREAFKTVLVNYPIIVVCFSTFSLLFGITYLKLIKEQFIFKLQLH